MRFKPVFLGWPFHVSVCASFSDTAVVFLPLLLRLKVPFSIPSGDFSLLACMSSRQDFVHSLHTRPVIAAKSIEAGDEGGGVGRQSLPSDWSPAGAPRSAGSHRLIQAVVGRPQHRSEHARIHPGSLLLKSLTGCAKLPGRLLGPRTPVKVVIFEYGCGVLSLRFIHEVPEVELGTRHALRMTSLRGDSRGVDDVGIRSQSVAQVAAADEGRRLLENVLCNHSNIVR